MKKIKIGVFGVRRGSSMIKFCIHSDRTELVAICDKWEEGLKGQKDKYPDHKFACYTDFDEFLNHPGLEAVVLVNYANEHAPFAIKCLKAGKHVYSEVLPVHTMKEAVELIEAVEDTGKVYAYGENYCYMAAPYEMRRLYREGKIGEFEYAEGEYIHNCENIWHNITYGDEYHWRNMMYSTYYCTHSLGPIVHITGLRPVSVVGFESPLNERKIRVGDKAGLFAIEMVTFENGGIAKSIHGGLYKGSIWYTLYGSKGRAETAREDIKNGSFSTIYVNVDDYSGQYRGQGVDMYTPQRPYYPGAEVFGHGGADFYSMFNFVQKINGDPEADTIDVYEAMDMFLPGLFAYRSILAGGIPMEIPNLRDPAVREQWRNDTACTYPEIAGDMLLPTMRGGTPEIPASVYEEMKRKYENRNKK